MKNIIISICSYLLYINIFIVPALAQTNATLNERPDYLNVNYILADTVKRTAEIFIPIIKNDSVFFVYRPADYLSSFYRAKIIREYSDVDGYVYLFLEEQNGSKPRIFTFKKAQQGRHFLEITNPLDKSAPVLRLEQWEVKKD